MFKRRLSAVFAALTLWGAVPAHARDGFRIDASRHAMSAEVLASLNTQLDVVESVGLPPQVLDAMKKTPIVIDPDLDDDKPGKFIVRRGVGAVHIRPTVFSPKRPIVLHELLHSYHVNVLGRDRPEIHREYERVKNAGLFPPRFLAAHFMKNEKEFFAVTATLYLFGDLQQPPFQCAALAKLDAGYLAFLHAHFGPNRCRALAQSASPAE